MTHFNSIIELEARLLDEGIDTAMWGQGVYKSLDNLWQEMLDGDSVLSGDPLSRALNFVQIIIRQNGRTLIETKQQQLGAIVNAYQALGGVGF